MYPAEQRGNQRVFFVPIGPEMFNIIICTDLIAACWPLLQDIIAHSNGNDFFFLVNQSLFLAGHISGYRFQGLDFRF